MVQDGAIVTMTDQ